MLALVDLDDQPAAFPYGIEGYDPSDDVLWGVLNDIDTACTAEVESRPLADDLSLQLWHDPVLEVVA